MTRVQTAHRLTGGGSQQHDSPFVAEPLKAGPSVPRQDASALQSLLERQFSAPREEPAVAASHPPKAEPAKPLSTSRILKVLAGLAIIATVGWMPMQRLLQVSSVEAVVNAPVITLRAPIDGVVGSQFGTLRVGNRIGASQPLIGIDNERVDTHAMMETNDALAQFRASRAGNAARLRGLGQQPAPGGGRPEASRRERRPRLGAAGI